MSHSEDPFLNYSGSGIITKDVFGSYTIRDLEGRRVNRNRGFLSSVDDGTGTGGNRCISLRITSTK